ncbi:hypothetical protein NKR23_g10860 [Pleurostoma richardsiae]|uniref:Ecp2 effector protein-like domain-containing protein n=1 Tax=Pleurostoma richardsiae TaxID=41990 RepID=A0AA38RBP9_9PEZI|nr:hypothetical protein NKR23_g10860 [Pleurostoma richardsiae]
MHFTAAVAFLIIPLGVLCSALPAVSEQAQTTSEAFTTSAGEVRTVHFHRSVGGEATAQQTSSTANGSGAGARLRKRFQFTASGEDRDLCGASSFVDKTSGGSPTVADCICLRDFIRGKQGVYSVNRDDPRFDRLATCGTCTFGVDTANFFGTDLGNTDAADIITSAIDMFQSGGLIGAEGRVGCDNAFQTAGTDWAIFHS